MISTLRVTFCVALSTTLLACDGPAEQTLVITEIRQAPAPAKAARQLSMAQRFGGVRAPAPTPAGLRLDWKVPPGWKQVAPTDMRPVNLVVPPDGQCYVTTLPGRAGGVQDNLNRWRKQMSLPPATREELAALPQRTVLGVRGIEVVLDGTFTGMGGAPRAGSRLRGVIATFQGHTVFVKFIGSQATVEQAGAAFEAFCGSLRPKAQRGRAPHPPAGGAKPPVGPPSSPFAGLKWSQPAGWQKSPSPSRMRLVTFTVDGLPKSECYLTVLQGAAGGEAANLERWQDQLGLAPLGESGLAALKRVEALGQTVALFEGVGTFPVGETPTANTYLAGCAILVEGQTLFVKFVVPGGGAAAGRDGFLTFLKSLRIGK